MLWENYTDCYYHFFHIIGLPIYSLQTIWVSRRGWIDYIALHTTGQKTYLHYISCFKPWSLFSTGCRFQHCLSGKFFVHYCFHVFLMDWDQSRDLKVWFFWRYYVVVLIQVGELQICICPAPTYMWGQRMLSTFLIFNPIFWRFTYSIALASNKESGLPKIWFSVIYSISSLNRGGTNCFRGKWWLAENKKDNGT